MLKRVPGNCDKGSRGGGVLVTVLKRGSGYLYLTTL